MFEFVKKCLFTGLTFLSTLTSTNSVSCISMNNQECFFPFSIKTRKCSGSCTSINNPYAKMCVPDVVKNLNVKAFNLMSRTNETRHIKLHETCKYKRRLDASVCNYKQLWNDAKYRFEYEELFDKCVFDKDFIWNTSHCECECDKLCDVGECLDYENCKCRKKNS